MSHLAQTALSLSCVFLLCASANAQQTIDKYPSAVAGGSDDFGSAVARIDDLDGDGRPDLLVGARRDNANGWATGRVDVISSADGSMIHSLTGSNAGDLFGTSLCSPGDVNSDGVADFAVGATGAPLGAEDGAISMFSGADATLLWTIQGPTSSCLGRALISLDDLNGDGVRDLAVSAPEEWTSSNYYGAIHVLSGADGSSLHTVIAQDDHSPFGRALCALDDVDGDGKGDYVIGSPFGPSPVLIVSGANGSVLNVIPEPSNASMFGGSVGNAGDLNGDGISDLLVGAPAASALQTFGGAVFAYSGADASLLWRQDGNQIGISLGWTVSGAGDADGDGNPDVAAGAPGGYLYWMGSVQGRIAYYSATGSPLATLWGDPNLATGSSMAFMGDIGGDGFDDLLLGEPGHLSPAAFVQTASIRNIRAYGPPLVEASLNWVPGQNPATQGLISITSTENPASAVLMSSVSALSTPSFAFPSMLGLYSLDPGVMPLLIDINGSPYSTWVPMNNSYGDLSADISDPNLRGTTFFMQAFTVEYNGNTLRLSGSRGLEFRL